MSANPRFTRVATTDDGNADLDAAWAAARRDGEVVKDEPETLLLRHPGPADAPAWWKLYRVPAWRRVQAWFTRSRGLREWRALRALQRAGVPAVQALAAAERRSLLQLHESLLVTTDAAGHRDLRDLLAADPPPPARRALLAAAGRAARQLHERGFGHFRLQLRNLLVPPAGPDEPLVVLDAPYACAYPGPAPARVRAIDLVDLAGVRSGLPAEDARVVLYAYAGDGPPPLSLRRLCTRRPFPQKLRRIATYLLHTHTGHKPAA